MYKSEAAIIKKSPVVIVKNFIALQLTAGVLLFFGRVVADYGELYRNLFLSRSISFHIAEAILIFLFETLLVFYIFFAWYKEYYEIKPDAIVHARGIVFRHRTLIPLSSILSATSQQGPLGKLTRYGTIVIGQAGEPRSRWFGEIKFKDLPEPQKVIEMIMQAKSRLIGHGQEMPTVRELIGYDEHEGLEFKSSFRWDHHQNKVNKNLEKTAMKSIAAFMNSGGGHLVIGVDDARNIVGIQHDYQSLPKPTSDGFMNHVTNVFHSMIGPEFRQFIKLSCQTDHGKDACVVTVAPSHKPAYLKSDDKEEFYIRTGNGTTALRLSEATSYIDAHWQK